MPYDENLSFDNLSDDLALSPMMATRKLAGPESVQMELFEESLRRSAWFAYRIIKDPVDRTHAFVHAYNKAASAMVHKTPDISTTQSRKFMKANGVYLKRWELFAPWCEPYEVKGVGQCYRLSKRWKHWTQARRIADSRRMPYDIYIGSGIASALRRGWPGIPTPAQIAKGRLLGGALHDADKYTDATIDGIWQKIATLPDIMFVNEAYYKPDAYVGSVEQNDYLAYLASRVEMKYGRSQRAQRAWTNYQRDGKIASSVGFDFAISHYQSSVTAKIPVTP